MEVSILTWKCISKYKPYEHVIGSSFSCLIKLCHTKHITIFVKIIARLCKIISCVAMWTWHKVFTIEDIDIYRLYIYFECVIKGEDVSLLHRKILSQFIYRIENAKSTKKTKIILLILGKQSAFETRLFSKNSTYRIRNIFVYFIVVLHCTWSYKFHANIHVYIRSSIYHI